MKQKYFFKELPLNADLKRHSEEEKRLTGIMDNTECEKVRSFYQNLLGLLRESKAELANKIGRKK